MVWERSVPDKLRGIQFTPPSDSRYWTSYPLIEVPEGVRGADQETFRLEVDSDDTLGLPGAHGGSPEFAQSSVTETVTLMVAVWPLLSTAVISTTAFFPGWVS